MEMTVPVVGVVVRGQPMPQAEAFSGQEDPVQRAGL